MCVFRSSGGQLSWYRFPLSTFRLCYTPWLRGFLHPRLLCTTRKCRAQALKRLTAVQKHFADFQEDQFDFHTYCARKSTLRAYMAMLRMQDTIFAHPSYSKVPHSPRMALGVRL